MKIDFEFDTPHGIFRDALHLPDDHAMTNQEIEAIKQQRVNDWIAIVNGPVVEETSLETTVETNTEE